MEKRKGDGRNERRNRGGKGKREGKKKGGEKRTENVLLLELRNRMHWYLLLLPRMTAGLSLFRDVDGSFFFCSI